MIVVQRRGCSQGPLEVEQVLEACPLKEAISLRLNAVCFLLGLDTHWGGLGEKMNPNGASSSPGHQRDGTHRTARLAECNAVCHSHLQVL